MQWLYCTVEVIVERLLIVIVERLLIVIVTKYIHRLILLISFFWDEEAIQKNVGSHNLQGHPFLT
jgi:hypothetical protein